MADHCHRRKRCCPHAQLGTLAPKASGIVAIPLEPGEADIDLLFGWSRLRPGRARQFHPPDWAIFIEGAF